MTDKNALAYLVLQTAAKKKALLHSDQELNFCFNLTKNLFFLFESVNNPAKLKIKITKQNSLNFHFAAPQKPVSFETMLYQFMAELSVIFFDVLL